MQKIVINKCYGGFGLSKPALDLYANLAGLPTSKDVHDWDIDRDNPTLIKVIETLGCRTSSDYNNSELQIVEIPDGIEWTIEEYDGLEWIAEKHRTWG